MKRTFTTVLTATLFLAVAACSSGHKKHMDKMNHQGMMGKNGQMMEMMTPEMHKKMAEMHQKMAECLESEKSKDECREMLRKECPMAKDGQCPMMGSDSGKSASESDGSHSEHH